MKPDKPTVKVTIRTKDDTITVTTTLDWNASTDDAIKALEEIAEKINSIHYSVVPADFSGIAWDRNR